MQFLQEFSIKQGVIFTRTGLILGFVWEFWGNRGRLRARIGEVVWCFEKGVLGVGSGGDEGKISC